MSKNNMSADSFLKSNEIVLLADNDPTPTKKVTPAARRRGYSHPKAGFDNPKYTSTPVKVSTLNRTIQLPITYSVVPTTPIAIKNEATCSSAAQSDVHVAVPVQRLAKPPASRTTAVLKRFASIPVSYNKPAKAASNGPKRETIVNGHISTPLPINRRRSIPVGLTITPVVQSTSKQSTVAENSNVICKPPQVNNIPAQTVSKNIDLKDKETLTRIAPKQPFQKVTTYYCVKTGETSSKSDGNFSRSIIGKTTPPQEQQQQPRQTQPTTPTRGRPRGSKNKVHEPVCLTISSDDEEPSDELSEPIPNGPSTILRSSSTNTSYVSFGTKSAANNSLNRNSGEHHLKSKSMMRIEDEDGEEMEVDEEEEMEEEEDEEEEESPGEDLNSSVEIFPNEIIPSQIAEEQLQIKCRSIRIGSYKIHPVDDNIHILINLTADAFRFQVPSTKSMREMVNIAITADDIEQSLGHYGRCLPILFIFTTTACGERLRNQLRMLPNDVMFFDPDGEDDRQKIITFLIDIITDEQRNFMKHVFPTENVHRDVDQRVANEILVKSTPQHNQQPPLDGEIITNTVISNIINNAVVTNAVVNNAVINATVVNSVAGATVVRGSCNTAANYITPTSVTIVQTTAPAPVVIQTLPTKVIPATPAPVTKLLIYPPPPQTGGIAITSEDIMCLDDGEFVNDAIIDFYLRYLMNEKLSEEDRQRTHIFSSFFYPRLTQKSTARLRSGEDSSWQPSDRRHAQVRNWTKNIDIFEKDFIIIPINQNVHWFLAIICFPGLVPESSSKSSSIISKSSDDVTSTNEGELDEMDSSNMNSSSPLMNSIDDTKEQAGNIDDHSSDDASNSFSNEVNSSTTEEPIPEVPDSSTHPDKNLPHEKMPCILIFDSLTGPSRWRIVTTLREYLEMEWKSKKGTKRDFTKTAMRGHVPRVPQQTNFSDCGVYVLQYVESFFQNPFPYFSNVMPQLLDWFSPEKVTNKRKEIKDLIMEIHKEQASGKNSRGLNKKEIEKAVCSTTTSSPQGQNLHSLS